MDILNGGTSVSGHLAVGNVAMVGLPAIVAVIGFPPTVTAVGLPAVVAVIGIGLLAFLSLLAFPLLLPSLVLAFLLLWAFLPLLPWFFILMVVSKWQGELGQYSPPRLVLVFSPCHSSIFGSCSSALFLGLRSAIS